MSAPALDLKVQAIRQSTDKRAQESDEFASGQKGRMLRRYQPGDEAGILSLFRTVFGKERSPAYWQWQFRDNPEGRQILLAVTEEGEIVGQCAGIPVRVAIGNNTHALSQMVDQMAHPRFRQGLKRPGLQLALFLGFFREFMGPGRGDMVYGFPIPEYERLIARLAGTRVLQPVTALVGDLRDGHQGVVARMLRRRYRISRVDRFDPLVDRLWQRCRPHLPLAIIRDSGYLNWRYADCPEKSYILLLATDRWTGTPEGLAVLRPGLLEAPDAPVTLLMDWLAPVESSTLAGALLMHCHKVAVTAGRPQVRAWFPEYTHEYRLLRQLGYYREPTMYHLTANFFNDEIAVEWARTHWFYTMGDSDIF
jgi:hypothetical protein